MKAWRAVDAVAIEERQRRVAELGGAIHDRFGQRCALKKAEGGGGVEFDVRGHKKTMEPQRTQRTQRPNTLYLGVLGGKKTQSTIASINHPSVTRSRKIRYTAPSLSETSHSSRFQ